MCLIIASQDGRFVADDIVRQGFTDNPDSWGIMTANGRKTSVYRGFGWDAFERDYTRLKTDPYVIHFRYATHGEKDIANCHPFKVSSRLHMAHNGIIHIAAKNKKMSDTWHYAQLLRERGIGDGNVSDHLESIGKEIGVFNKIAFLAPSGEISIANHHAGVIENGVWLSNDNSLWQLESKMEWSCDGFGQCEYCLTDDWIEPIDIDGFKLELCDMCVRWAERRGGIRERQVA